MSRDLAILLADIQSAGLEILAFTQGMSQEEAMGDRKTKLAVIQCFQIMGAVGQQSETGPLGSALGPGFGCRSKT
jgi:uncharacterized protein with HEPN domain